MDYADYGYYTDAYLGTAIAAEDFPRLARRASERVDYLTFQRAARYYDTNPAPVQNATCAIAEVLQQVERGNLLAQTGGVIQSEATGKHHVTYAVPTSTMTENGQRAMDKAVMSVATQYLLPTGLLYRGVTRC